MATAETVAGMHLTGRRVAGPVSELVELESEEGVLHTAIVFNKEYRGLAVMNQAVELSRSFMEFPMVTGLVELSNHLPDEGTYVYPTGNTRSVAEIMQYYKDTNNKFSKRAALELCFLAAQVLQEAAETGPQQGVYSHADLSPHRLLVREDSDVQIIGYGLPSPEMLAWVKDAKKTPSAEAAWYAPPERLQGAPEDVSSDLYALALIVAEMISLSPVIGGEFDEAKDVHLNGGARGLLGKVKRTIGAPVADLLDDCVQFDPRNRYDSGEGFIEAVRALLDGIAGGDSLEDAVKPVFAQKIQRKLRAVKGAAPPGFRGPARGRSIRAPEIPQGEQPDAGGRWGKVSRKKEDEEEEETSRRGRRRRRTRDKQEEEEVKVEEETTSRRRSRRSRRSAEPEEEAKKEEVEAEEEDVSSSRRRRRRRSSAEEEKTEDAEEKAAEPSASSRRRRRSTAKEEPEAKAEPEAKEEEASTSSRRRRRSPAKAEEPPEAKEEEPSTSRRRRRRSAASDDDSSDDDGDDDDSASTRRRRRRK